MSADKFHQLSDAFFMISRGFAQVADIMGSNDLSIPIVRSTDQNLSSSNQSALETETCNVSQVSESASPQVRVKKIKKQKDPNAPKRPLNAFFLFQRDLKDSIKPTETQSHQTLLKAAWDNLDPEIKNKYMNDAKALYDQFSAELKEYNLKNGQSKGESSSGAIEEVESLAENHENELESSSEESQLKKEKKKKRKSESSEVVESVTPIPIANQEGSESPSKKSKKKEKKQQTQE